MQIVINIYVMWDKSDKWGSAIPVRDRVNFFGQNWSKHGDSAPLHTTNALDIGSP